MALLFRNFINTSKHVAQTISYCNNGLYGSMNYGFAQTQFTDKLKDLKSAKIQQQGINFESGTAGNTALTHYGTNQFIQRVYQTTGISITSALAISQIAMSMQLPLGVAFMGGLMTLGGFIASSRMVPKVIYENVNGREVLRSQNSAARIGLYGVGVAGLGLGMSPLFAYANAINPAIIPISIGLSSMIFGGASLYAYTRKQGSLLGMQGALYSGLLGLIGIQIAGLLSNMIMGPNLFSMMCFRADTFLGVGLFSALVAYDTHVAIKSYQEGNPDHLGISIDFLLDFMNILRRVVEILTIFTRNSD